LRRDYKLQYNSNHRRKRKGGKGKKMPIKQKEKKSCPRFHYRRGDCLPGRRPRAFSPLAKNQDVEESDPWGKKTFTRAPWRSAASRHRRQPAGSNWSGSLLSRTGRKKKTQKNQQGNVGGLSGGRAVVDLKRLKPTDSALGVSPQ